MSRLDRLVKAQRSHLQAAAPPVATEPSERRHALVHELDCGIEGTRGNEAGPTCAVEQARTFI